MEEMEKTAVETESEIEEKPKRRGRKPWTEEQKREAAKKRAQRKAKAGNMTPEIMVQFQETEGSVNELVEAAKAQFKAEKKRTAIVSLKLYIKPEERAAYYVINDDYDGKVTY